VVYGLWFMVCGLWFERQADTYRNLTVYATIHPPASSTIACFHNYPKGIPLEQTTNYPKGIPMKQTTNLSLAAYSDL
jgi:hypothetical protein